MQRSKLSLRAIERRPLARSLAQVLRHRDAPRREAFQAAGKVASGKPAPPLT